MTTDVLRIIIADIVVSRCDTCYKSADSRCLTCFVRAVAVRWPALGLALDPLLPGAAPAVGLGALPGIAWLLLPAAAGGERIGVR